MMLADELECILEEAQVFASEHDKCTYEDYEYFKHKLHAKGLFGCESKIADILNI